MSGATLSSSSPNGTLNSGGVELTESAGRALKLQTDSPHLVSLGGGRLSTAVTVHPIPQGRVTLGSGPGVDIIVQGTGVEAHHCHIENSGGVVTIYPLSENLSIDGVPVTGPTRLSQGVMLTIGRSNYIRFNHPAEAKLIKSVLPNSRISMAPITFEHDHDDAKFNKKPPVIPRKIAREPYNDAPASTADDDDDDQPTSIQMKVSKFEYLAAQNFKKSISPKVFSANLVTVNTPARDVLGRAPPDLQDFAKNLPHSAINLSDSVCNEKEKMKTPDRQFFGRKSPQYVNVAIESKSINNRVQIYENGCIAKNAHPNVLLNVNIEQQQQPKNELNNINYKGQGKSININRTTTPSPSFNRNPSPNYGRNNNNSASPSSNTANCNSPVANVENNSTGDFHDVNKSRNEQISQRKNEAEIRWNQAHTERVKEQQIEKAEQARLDEIINMCAEYERQVQWEKNNKPTQNRIKTNGSLPRDKRQCRSPGILTSTPSPHSTKEAAIFRFDTDHHNYENFTPSPEVARRMHYENVEMHKPMDAHTSTYENVYVVENNCPYPQSPRTRIKTIPSAQMMENKFAVAMAESKEIPAENKELELQRKPTPTKFLATLGTKGETGPSSSPKTSKGKSEEDMLRMEVLIKEKHDAMAGMAKIKRKMADVEIQEEELTRDLEMEKALISGEHKSKLFELEELDERKKKLLEQARQIETKMEDCQQTQNMHQESCKAKLHAAQENLNKIEAKLNEIGKGTAAYDELFEEFLAAQETLDCEKKTFEDLEFHHLEEEADWLASREEIQREIMDLTQKMDHIQAQVEELEQQKIDTSKSNAQESKTLERQLIKYLRRLEEYRNKTKTIDAELRTFVKQESDQEVSSDSDSEKAKNSGSYYITNMGSSFIETSSSKLIPDNLYNMSQSFNEKMLQEKSVLDVGFQNKRYPSQDDIDRISKVTSNAPMNIEDGRGSLGKKTIESLKEIERNRQICLVQQGSQVIEEERRRVLALKEKAQREVRSQWEKKKKDSSLTSSVAEEVQNNVTTNEEAPQPSLDENVNKHEEDAPKIHSESEEPESPRPLSDTSDVSVEVGTLGRRRARPSADKTRPLTRYLPIRSPELDLRQHIESAGHQVVLCPHVLINSTSCRGFLHKRGSKLNGWSKRWFVFDRNKRTLVYYADKSEKKARGGAYFQAIEEVFLDHANSVKSPNPHLTFIVKTHQRYYYLMAPSPEAMRIWIDVIFTGAEGYQEFEHGT